MINYAHSKNIYVTTSTNGHYLNFDISKQVVLSGLDKIIISIDGSKQDTYQKYRINGNFEKVIEGIKNLVYWKKKLNIKKPYIVLQFLVMSINEFEIEEIRKISKELKVDKLELKSLQVTDFVHNSYLIPKILKFNRYKIENEHFKLKWKLHNRCYRIWNSTVITHEGNVLPCCFDKSQKYIFGNIKNESLKKIIYNSIAKQFRNNILQNRKLIKMCNNCTTK
jgi:radical SAM protein with 4Fe4S-binding SPASM domain